MVTIIYYCFGREQGIRIPEVINKMEITLTTFFALEKLKNKINGSYLALPDQKGQKFASMQNVRRQQYVEYILWIRNIIP